jgi:peptidyl-prolyl cis-trans isomerase D
MLQILRKYTQGWVAILLGVLLSFAFVLWGIENYLSGSSKKHLAAKVNGEGITSLEVESDFRRSLIHIKDQMGANANLPPSLQQQLKLQSLNNLIVQTILYQSGYKLGLRVTPQIASAMIKQMPAFQENGKFSKERFYQIINRMGYTQQEFFNDISKTLMLNQIASGLGRSEFVLPNESKQAITLLEQKRDIQYAIMPSAKFKDTIKISPEQINVYYITNKNQFKVPAKVQIQYVILSSEELKKSVHISENEIQDYFEANGDLDKNDKKTVGKVKELVKQQKLEQMFLTANDKLTDLIYTHPNSLNAAADALGLMVMTSNYFTEDGGNSEISKNAKILAMAFNSELLKNRTNSNLIELTQGKVAAIRIKDYQPEAFAPLNQVQNKIKTHLIEANAYLQAKQEGMILLQKINSYKDFKSVLSGKHLKLLAKSHLSRYEKNMNPDILQTAFNIPANAKKPFAGIQLANGDFAIIFLNNSIDFPAEKITDHKRDTMIKLYSETYSRAINNLYIENQLHSAKVKIYQK